MGRKLFQPDPQLDLYIEWSSIVESPVGWGTKQQFLNEGRWNEQEFERIAKYGSTWPGEDWEIYMQQGYMYWKDMPRMIELRQEGKSAEDPEILALLEPFEWAVDDEDEEE